MALVIDLGPEGEAALNRLAEARGVTPEAYLQVLVAELACTRNDKGDPSLAARMQRVLSGFGRSKSHSELADDALRAMRGKLLEHKERAVEAVAKAEMLDRMRDSVLKRITQSELQALTHARAGNAQYGLRRFQESCIFGEIARELHERHSAASERANELLAVFRQEERKANRMLPRARSAAMDAVSETGSATHLPAAEMEKRIAALGTSDEWSKRYESWIRSQLDGANLLAVSEIKFVVPEFSAEELSELELELMCDKLRGRAKEGAQ